MSKIKLFRCIFSAEQAEKTIEEKFSTSLTQNTGRNELEWIKIVLRLFKADPKQWILHLEEQDAPKFQQTTQQHFDGVSDMTIARLHFFVNLLTFSDTLKGLIPTEYE